MKKKIFLLMLGILFLFSFASASLTDNVYSYYNLDETSSLTAYDSLGLLNLTNRYTNETGFTGIINNAYNFTNSYSYKTNFGSGATNSNITVSLWYKVTTNPSSGFLLDNRENTGQGRGYALNFPTANRIRFGISTNDTTDNALDFNAPPAGQWNNLIAVYNGTYLTIYVNGTYVNSTAQIGSGRVTSAITTMVLASRYSLDSGFYNGLIDEVGIWSRALNSTEVSQIYNNGFGNHYPFTFAPVIQLNAPVDTYNQSNLSIITFNTTITNPPSNVSIYLDGILNETNSSGLEGVYLFSKYLGNGIHTWFIQACNSDSCTNSSTRTLTIDIQAPQLSLISPNETYNYLQEGSTLYISGFANDTNLDSVWYSYNGTNTTISGATTATLFNQSFNQSTSDKTSLRLWANDTFGNTNSSLVTWGYKVFENLVSYNTPVYSTSTEQFTANYTIGRSYSSISADLIYNGTIYEATVQDNGYLIVSKNLSMPSVSSETNLTFYLSLNFGDEIINSSTFNQTVNPISFGICGGSLIYPMINFTTKSAENPFPIINATFKTAWQITATDGGETTSYSFEDVTETNSSWKFCSAFNNTLYVDAQIEYDAQDYTLNSYYLENANLTNETNYINLYTLNASKATVTTLLVRDDIQNPIEDVLIQIQLYDVGTDAFYLVGMGKTSFNGEDVAYLNWYDSLYRFILIQNGEVIKSTNTTRISETPQIFDILEGETFSFEKFRDFEYSLTFNNLTNNFILSYTKPNGLVDQGCLRVIKRISLNDTTICNQCSSSASSTLYCNVDGYGNGTFIGTFYATGSWYLLDILTTTIGKNFSESIFDLLDKEDSAFYTFFLSGIIVAMFMVNAVLGIVGIILALLASSAFGFIQISYVIFAGVIILGVIIIWWIKR